MKKPTVALVLSSLLAGIAFAVIGLIPLVIAFGFGASNAVKSAVFGFSVMFGVITTSRIPQYVCLRSAWAVEHLLPLHSDWNCDGRRCWSSRGLWASRALFLAPILILCLIPHGSLRFSSNSGWFMTAMAAGFVAALPFASMLNRTHPSGFGPRRTRSSMRY